MSEPLHIGDVLTITTRFYSPTGYDPIEGAGSLVSPSSVVVQARNPLGTIITPAASQVATGVWFAEQPLTLGGVWSWRVAGSGGHQGAEEGHVLVASSAFG